MRSQILKYWNRIRSSFWFIPVIMSGGAVLLAYGSVALDATMTNWFENNWDLTLTTGAEGASAVLGTIAGSMITIAGVVFSMTLVALSLTTSQLGPRLLRNFMRDTTTQVVLGTFVATFLYCLLVLRTIRRAEESLFVPQLSVSLGVLLAVVSVGVLIYFIHHVSVSVQANEIVAQVGEELIKGIDRLFLDQHELETAEASIDPPDDSFFEAFDRNAQPVAATGDGYLQFIDKDTLISLATEEDAVIRLEQLPGHYVVAGRPLVLIWPGDRVSDKLERRVNLAFALGHERLPDQDIEFVVNQLVEIAVRALSAGINDPFTAIVCIDRLRSGLCRLAQREIPSPYLYDQDNKLRVIASPCTFPAIMDAAFNQIRQNSSAIPAITIRLLEAIATIARFTHRSEDRDAILRHADMISRGADECLLEKEDRRVVVERYQQVLSALVGEP
ncbi:MAG: DUF2254 domain-containing protein [Chloroflexota bacterium]